MKKRNRGFTIAELLLATMMVAVIIGALAFMFQVVIGSWSTQGARTGAASSAGKAVTQMAGELRNAKEIGSYGSNEVRFTADGSRYYIYYLYNAADSYPSGFKKESYQLKRTALSGKIDGTFTYGSGDLIARDILPPPTSELSFAAPIVTLDLSVRRGSSVIRQATKVRLRNM